MKIIRHYRIDDKLQRSEVTFNHSRYRRIVRWVNTEGDLSEIIPPSEVWQEQRAGVFLKVFSDKAAELEKQFIEALIKDNEKSSD